MTAAATEQLETEGPVVSRVDWAPVPRVNLLPREIIENRKFRNVQVGLALVVVLTLVLAGAAFWWSDGEVAEAEEARDAAEAQTVLLRARQRSYAAVPETLAALDYAQTARQTVMTNDVTWYRYLSDLADAAPADVTFQSLTLTVPRAAESVTAAGGGTAAGAAGDSATADPFQPAGALGAVSVQGISGTYPKVAAWMDALDRIAGLDVSTLESAARGSGTDTAITFSSGITVTHEALSHRYDRKAS